MYTILSAICREFRSSPYWGKCSERDTDSTRGLAFLLFNRSIPWCTWIALRWAVGRKSCRGSGRKETRKTDSRADKFNFIFLSMVRWRAVREGYMLLWVADVVPPRGQTNKAIQRVQPCLRHLPRPSVSYHSLGVCVTNCDANRRKSVFYNQKMCQHRAHCISYRMDCRWSR